jgi:hypothetical protein
MRSAYVPAWTFDAVVDSQWSADAGWYYTVMEPRPVMVNGRMQMQMVPAESALGTGLGSASRRVTTFVRASRGVNDALSQKLGGYDLKALVPYRPESAGWRAEEYAVDLDSA